MDAMDALGWALSRLLAGGSGVGLLANLTNAICAG